MPRPRRSLARLKANVCQLSRFLSPRRLRAENCSSVSKSTTITNVFTVRSYLAPRQFEAEHFKKGSNFFEENVTATSSQKRNEVQESKRNKWKGPTRSVGSSPFMPDYDLEPSEVF